MSEKKCSHRSVFHKFSCEHYSELASRSIDEKLSLKDRILFWLHHVVCTFCRRFNRQIKAIDMGMRQNRADNEDIQSELFTLSRSTKDRMKSELRSESQP